MSSGSASTGTAENKFLVDGWPRGKFGPKEVTELLKSKYGMTHFDIEYASGGKDASKKIAVAVVVTIPDKAKADQLKNDSFENKLIFENGGKTYYLGVKRFRDPDHDHDSHDKHGKDDHAEHKKEGSKQVYRIEWSSSQAANPIDRFMTCSFMFYKNNELVPNAKILLQASSVITYRKVGSALTTTSTDFATNTGEHGGGSIQLLLSQDINMTILATDYGYQRMTIVINRNI